MLVDWYNFFFCLYLLCLFHFLMMHNIYHYNIHYCYLIYQGLLFFICRYLFRLDEKVRSLYGNGTQIKKLVNYLDEINYPCSLIYNDQIHQQTPIELAHVFDLIIIPEKRLYKQWLSFLRSNLSILLWHRLNVLNDLGLFAIRRFKKY